MTYFSCNQKQRMRIHQTNMHKHNYMESFEAHTDM
jgi:hypothetical protein